MQNFLNPPWEPMILSLQTGPRLRATNPGSQTPASTATRPTAALDQWLTPASFPAFPLTAGMWRQICPPGNHVGHPSFCQPASSSSSQLQSWKACLFFHQKSCPLPHEPGVSASGEWRLTPLLCRRVLDKLACSHRKLWRWPQWWRIHLSTWMWVQSRGWEECQGKKTATEPGILAWRIPWTEEPGGLQSIGRRV